MLTILVRIISFNSYPTQNPQFVWEYGECQVFRNIKIIFVTSICLSTHSQLISCRRGLRSYIDRMALTKEKFQKYYRRKVFEGHTEINFKRRVIFSKNKMSTHFGLIKNAMYLCLCIYGEAEFCQMCCAFILTS